MKTEERASQLRWLLMGAAGLLVYVVLNIVGTYYHTLLITTSDIDEHQVQVSEPTQTISLVTVLVGWSGLPLVNLVSPILYHQKSTTK